MDKSARFSPESRVGRDVVEMVAFLLEELLKLAEVHGKRYFAPPCLWCKKTKPLYGLELVGLPGFEPGPRRRAERQAGVNRGFHNTDFGRFGNQRQRQTSSWLHVGCAASARAARAARRKSSEAAPEGVRQNACTHHSGEVRTGRARAGRGTCCTSDAIPGEGRAHKA